MQKRYYNILLLIDSLLAGGAEKVQLTLSRKLSERGHNVTLLNLSSKVALEIPEEIKFINCNYRRTNFRNFCIGYKNFWSC
ncbi:MAG: hypothetical protein CML08_03290 [Puniceicoccaceae bacterium]|nr:hypothetical protein [Puniceicoccaceae bacterium]